MDCGGGNADPPHDGITAKTASTPSGVQVQGQPGPHKSHNNTPDNEPHQMELEEEEDLISVKKSYLDSLLKENKKLRKTVALAKGMFKNQWGFRSIQWKQMQQDLDRLQEEEAELEGVVRVMKTAMGEANLEILRKEEEHGKLTERLMELREGKDHQKGSPVPPINSKEEDVEVTKSGSGGPGPTQGKDAESIFPEEVWKIIFTNLSDPKDLWSLCLTCPLFTGILSQWRTGWLLEQALPHLYRHLPWNKLLETRLVCKSWNAVTLNFLENHSSLRAHSSSTDPRKLEFINPASELGLGTSIDFSSNDDQVPLLDDPDFRRRSCRNPFIGRYAILNMGEDDYQFIEDDGEEGEIKSQKLWAKLYKFLDTFGTQIWYLSVDIPMEFTEAAISRAHQFATRDVFRLAPNLRKFRVSETFDKTTIIDPESLPPAPKLETIESETVAKDPISTALLSRHHLQLRKIHLTPEIWRTIAHLEWPQVTELYLDSIRGTGCFESLSTMQIPNLTKLGLALAFSPRYLDNDFTFNKLLNLIHKVSSTTSLNTLRLSGHKMMMRGHPEFARSHCAPFTLRTLEIDHYCPSWTGNRGAPSYSFLVRCFPLIQNLHLFLQSTALDELGNDMMRKMVSEIGLLPEDKCEHFLSRFKVKDEILEVNRYLGQGNMYKSNIWELLPQLKVFSFQWDVFTRDGYEEYLRRKV